MDFSSLKINDNIYNVKDENARRELVVIQGKIEELFTSGVNAKRLISSAINSKGVESSPDDSFETMANDILSIDTIKQNILKYFESPVRIIGDNIWYDSVVLYQNDLNYNIYRFITGNFYVSNLVFERNNVDFKIVLIGGVTSDSDLQNGGCLIVNTLDNFNKSPVIKQNIYTIEINDNNKNHIVGFNKYQYETAYRNAFYVYLRSFYNFYNEIKIGDLKSKIYPHYFYSLTFNNNVVNYLVYKTFNSDYYFAYFYYSDEMMIFDNAALRIKIYNDVPPSRFQMTNINANTPTGSINASLANAPQYVTVGSTVESEILYWKENIEDFVLFNSKDIYDSDGNLLLNKNCDIEDILFLNYTNTNIIP